MAEESKKESKKPSLLDENFDLNDVNELDGSDEITVGSAEELTLDDDFDLNSIEEVTDNDDGFDLDDAEEVTGNDGFDDVETSEVEVETDDIEFGDDFNVDEPDLEPEPEVVKKPKPKPARRAEKPKPARRAEKPKPARRAEKPKPEMKAPVKKPFVLDKKKKMILGGAGVAVLMAVGTAVFMQSSSQPVEAMPLSIPVSSVSPMSGATVEQSVDMFGDNAVTSSEESFMPDMAMGEIAIQSPVSASAPEMAESPVSAMVTPNKASALDVAAQDELLNDNMMMAKQLEELIRENEMLSSTITELKLKVNSKINPSQLAKLKKNNHLYAVEIDSLKRRLKNREAQIAKLKRGGTSTSAAMASSGVKVSGVIPDWTLKGVVGGRALFSNANGKTSMAEEGDVINGVKITGIDGDKLSVKTDNGTLSLK